MLLCERHDGIIDKYIDYHDIDKSIKDISISVLYLVFKDINIYDFKKYIAIINKFAEEGGSYIRFKANPMNYPFIVDLAAQAKLMGLSTSLELEGRDYVKKPNNLFDKIIINVPITENIYPLTEKNQIEKHDYLGIVHLYNKEYGGDIFVQLCFDTVNSKYLPSYFNILYTFCKNITGIYILPTSKNKSILKDNEFKLTLKNLSYIYNADRPKYYKQLELYLKYIEDPNLFIPKKCYVSEHTLTLTSEGSLHSCYNYINTESSNMYNTNKSLREQHSIIKPKCATCSKKCTLYERIINIKFHKGIT